MKKIMVSDKTLKVVDGQGLFLKFREKLAIAERLDLARVNAIELPALSNSKEDEVVCRTIASSVKNAIVKIPVGDNAESVEKAFNCIKSANSYCLQVVMPVSTALMEYNYHLKAPAMQEKIGELIELAKSYCDKVEFVAIDAFRAEENFLFACAKTAEEKGACCICISDDSGEAFPEDFARVVKEVKNACNLKIFVSPSDSFKMSSACALEGIKVGAEGVETSAIGEYLSAAVFADVIRAKKYAIDCDCDVDVSNVKTIANVIKGIAEPEESQNVSISTTKLSSSASMQEVVETVKQLGYELSDSDFGKVYEEFKKLTAKKEVIDNKELEAVIASTAMQVPSTYHLVNYVVNSGNIIPATANVTLEKDGEKFTGVSTGDGPIDAAFHAIEQIIGHHYDLDDFQVHAVTKGRGAVGSSIIRLRADGKLYPGNGVSTDIVGACIRAYINALNKIVYEEN